jgi:glycosyltransferase involved in cell wall biosynthesis
VRLNFLLHDYSRWLPMGGLKVEYELANRLGARGHDVAVYHSLNFDRAALRHPRSLAGAVRANLVGPRAVQWFQLAPYIRCRYLPQLKPELLRAADATIVDSFIVTERIRRTTPRTGPIVHIVYEYPVWQYGSPDLRDRLIGSLRRRDVVHIATSSAVASMLGQCGVTPEATIPCGLSLPDMCGVPPAHKRPAIVGFALRPETYKGVEDMLAALPEIRRACPKVTFDAFGRYRDGQPLPATITNYGQLADAALSRFYERIAVFVSPSHAEGWGLTAAEAMAHGAAVVTADNGGATDFAIHGETALVVPVADPRALAEATVSLLQDLELRRRIAAAGVARTRSMSWDNTVTAVDDVLTKVIQLRHTPD